MLRDIVLLQKRELESRLQEKYIERDVGIGLFADDRLIRVITGPRRAGKSFFGVHSLNKVGPFGYINFDDERLVETRNYDEIIAAIDSVYGKPKTLLLDEVQNLEKWELFVNRLQRQGYRLVITGSNANLLSSELATHLTGRYLSLLLFPFSFREYLHTLGNKLSEAEMKETLGIYVEQGGYPEPLVHAINGREYLSNLVHSILYKDIVKRSRIRAVQGLEDLSYYLFSNVTKEFSYRTLSKVTRCRSPHTVEKYLRYLEEAFLFFPVKRFSYKVKEQTSSNKKVYCTDNGLVTASGFRLSPDKGRLYENLVAIELYKLSARGGGEMYYWKSSRQEEVDFVIKEGLTVIQLIQVSFDVSDPKTKNREVRALIKASEALKCDNLLILTGDIEKKESLEWFGVQREVRFVPVWKWLLEKKNIR